jgi:secreted Zn-dependent insulinase-like peptidase
VNYSITAQTLQSSLTLLLQGYSHKLPVLAQTVLQVMMRT